MGELNDRERKFVESYCSDAKFNGTKAAVNAGYSEKSARSKASQLLTKVNIHNAIQEFMNKESEKASITVQSLIEELNENRRVALEAETPQASAANAATMGKARLCGLDVQKIENSVKVIKADDNEW